MQPGTRPPRNRCPAVAAAAIACALAAALLATPSYAGILSPRLTELAKPSVSGALPSGQARALSVAPQGPGSLLRDGNRVLAYVRFAPLAAGSANALRAAGAKLVNVSGRYQSVTVAAKPQGLRALAAVPGVLSVREALAPLVSAVGPKDPFTSSTEQCFGAATSEGDEQLRAAEARNAFGVDGGGVTVGILSDSFNASESADTDAGEDIKTGDLPGPANPCGFTTPVQVFEEIEEPEEGEDEGRAMAQIVHDLAPGAKLAFASAFNGEESFAENIERLAEPVGSGGAGAEVIADDVVYLDEPFFQDGPVAVATDKVREEGVAYFSAAGNDNLFNGSGDEIASWEAPSFRDVGSCPTGAPGYATHCMDFDPGAATDTGFGITVEPEETLTVDLQWSQPWHGVTTDLDAYLLRNGSLLGEAEEPNVVAGFQEPVEILSWTNPSSSSRTVELAIDRCNLACGTARAAAKPELTGTTGGDSGTPRLKLALLENGGGVSATEYPKSIPPDAVGPTIFGHSGAAGAVSVAAVPFFSDSEPEPYSSRGPVKHFFGPVEGVAPATALKSTEELSKPDLAATDGGANTFFGVCLSHVWRFFGTSAAAPHAAAVAALELSAEPAAGAGEVIEAEEEAAQPLGSFPAEAVGSGLVDAVGALERITGTSPAVEPVASPPPPPDCVAKEEESFQEAEEKITTANPAASTEQPPKGRGPATFLRRHPRHVIRTREHAATAVFRFGADQPGVTFFCRVDGNPIRGCAELFVRRYTAGPHVIRVVARNGEGQVDPTPVVFRFKVVPRN